jgi:hypothetical protein
VSQHINLYHAQFRPPRNPLPARYILAGAGLMLLVMLGLAGFDRWQLNLAKDNLATLETRADRLEAQMNGLASQVAGRQADPALAGELARLEAGLVALNRAEQAIRSGALGSATGYSGYFAALSRVRVAEVWLVGIDLGGEPARLSLSGRALADDGPVRYVGALRREPALAGLGFAGLEIKEAAGADGKRPAGLEFHLAAQAEPAPAQPEARP